MKQECIPVGCVPSAAVAVCFQERVSTPPGAGTPPEQAPPRSRHPPWSRPPGADPPWRPVARHAGIPPARHAGIPHPPPSHMDRHTCKNITFATSLRMVKLEAASYRKNTNYVIVNIWRAMCSWKLTHREPEGLECINCNEVARIC